MPSYEYKCMKCAHRFTDKQSFAEHDDHKQVKCPKCNSSKVAQQLSEVFAQTSKKS